MPEKAISSFFQNDHQRLDALFQRFQALKPCDFEEARSYFQEFKSGLERHIVWEEEILFPLFETKTGLKAGGPTSVMKMEHELIRGKLTELDTKVREENPNSNPEESELLNLLAQHNHKEEEILYPMMDRLTSEQERKRVLVEINLYPKN